jgi:hypothetical protein
LIACANKTHTVKGDGVAEACAVRTLTQPAHRPCSLVALRPPLRVCEPFFKISSWPSAAAETSRELQSADDRPTRCDCELVDHKSCAHRLGSLGCQPGPSKPELEVRLPSTNRRGTAAVLWRLGDLATSPYFLSDGHNSHCREGVSCAAVPGPFFLVRLPPPRTRPHPGRRGGYTL